MAWLLNAFATKKLNAPVRRGSDVRGATNVFAGSLSLEPRLPGQRSQGREDLAAQVPPTYRGSPVSYRKAPPLRRGQVPSASVVDEGHRGPVYSIQWKKVAARERALKSS